MTSRKAPAFQFYADDFIAGTMDMSPTEVGIYMRWLCHQWTKGSVPADRAKQQRIAGAGDAVFDSCLEAVISKFVVQEDGSLKNERLEVVREEQVAKRDVRVEAGKLGAASRWRDSKRDGKANGKHDGKANGKHDGKHDGKTMTKGVGVGDSSLSSLNQEKARGFPAPVGMIDTPEIQNLWSLFVDHVCECSGQPLTPMAAGVILMDLSKSGPEKAARDLRASIKFSKRGHLLDADRFADQPAEEVDLSSRIDQALSNVNERERQ